ncbi:LPS assembly protein LptD [Vibrio sp. HA2012]|uniref:LPS assembly protein LptD n=1 Tax=Vibrio sp. HA2012 TaxID=1971595 RepID=UPI000C2C3FAF|nr:LPS assembly protein LptD [Vibrio sp. HA2012]PJC85826.1 LPS assembly protein LptD [Vibrio sp. HA2012]
MSHFPRTFLTASISAALFVPATQAETSDSTSVQEMPVTDQCLIDNVGNNDTRQPVQVVADSVEGINGEKATYKGNVVVIQGTKRITADTLTLHQPESTVIAEGNVGLSDGQFKAESDKLTANLDTDDATLEQTEYHFLCTPARGEANYIHRAGKTFYEMEDGSLTSCPDGDNAWKLKASSITLDQNEEQATLYNTRLEVLDVPVFYMPYLIVPVGDTRKSGMLYPTVSMDSRDGFTVEVPVYWNLAPNYDLMTTINYMEDRGTQLDSQFRYLTTAGSGSINLEYLPEDKKYEELDARWGLNWNHSGIYDGAWKFTSNYSKVSDIDYFKNLSSSIGSREDGQLLQTAAVSYRSKSWDTTLKVKNFQVLSEDSYPYRLMPQLEFNYYAPELYSKLNFNLHSHISQFETDSSTLPDATRTHLEPILSLPLTTTWGTFTAESKLYYTYYQQDLKDNNSDYEESVSRSIPQFRVHSGLFLDRDTAMFDSLEGYTHTLEPQIQYLYIAEKDQSDIYSGYDTTNLQLDYYGLFRDGKYSSIDYIAPANQVSYGATSRFYDSNFRERMNISFGQIFYLDSTYSESASSDSPSSYSAWAVETEFNYDDTFFYQGGIQFDTASDQIQIGDSTFEYRYPSGSGFSQINYRYVSLDYIEQNRDFDDVDISDYTRYGISQLGFITSYDINKNWKAGGQYFYDTRENKNLEWFARLTYLSDCWYIGFSYSNQIYDWDTIGSGEPDYEKSFSFNFGIVGLATGMGVGSDSEASGNTLSYSRPFYLNN